MPAYKMHLDEPKSEPEAESEAQPQPELAPDSPAVVTLKSIASSLVLVERSVQTKEPRFVSRALRQTVSARKKMTFPVLSYALERLPASDLKDLSLTFVAMGTGMEMGEPDEFTVELAAPSVECQIYLVILAIQFLLDQKTLVGEAYALSGQLVAFAQAQNRRTGDALTAQSVYYHSLAAECLGTLPALRPKLLAAHRTAVLNHDEIGQAMYINLLLRNFMTPSGNELSLVDQADKLVNKSSFPDTASNNQYARYFYYLGKIKSTQLEYTEAQKYLNEALRKAPQTGVLGFRLTVTKLLSIVQLLKGEIPERSTFMEKASRAALAPYLQLTQAVREGDLGAFKAVVDQHEALFARDQLRTLINRLRHNVIKTGLRNINTSYSCISIADICGKLKLDDPCDAEYIVAKAIRDGVIDATIDHAARVLRSNPLADVYSSNEPQELYHQRIQFCLTVHNEAVTAMTYPEDLTQESESAEERLERLKQEQELAQEIAEEEDEDF